MKRYTCLFLLVLLCLGLYSISPVQAKWYKGNFHMHTVWSDGAALPEVAIARYQAAQYEFLCTTDHFFFQSDTLKLEDPWKRKNVITPDAKFFQGETSRWRAFNPNSDTIQEAITRFGADSLKTKKVGDQTFYRLKTFAELARQFNRPGKFLLIPGVELNTSAEGRGVHFNLINVAGDFLPIRKPTMTETIETNFKMANKLYGQQKEPWFFLVNHPMWPYYDISPEHILALPDLHYVELNNNALGSSLFDKDHPYALAKKAWNPEKFWDVVNAFRTDAGRAPIIALGSDDRHGYAPNQNAGHSWSYVDADELTPSAIVHAVAHSKVYTSNGLEFESIVFDKAKGTLTVKAKPAEGKTLRIEFLGTKKGFDKTVKEETIPLGRKPNTKKTRIIHYYSDDIGVVLQKNDSLQASYTLKNDDLYVRARVVTVPTTWKGSEGDCLPFPGAWTQAFTTKMDPK
ncbi:MAG: hypothetical protein PHQ75_07915 [Thermoguttaceae bacterium]|nr:hypothetical protein [Thermoguttaceae bacterium]